MASLRLAGLTAAVVLLAPVTALAADAEVTSDTAAQFYDVRSPTGENVLNRRRLTTTLAVSAYDLLDSPVGDPSAPDLSFRARVRYDADFGINGGSADPTNFGSVVPGLSQGAVDLMYAYVEGRRLLHGWLGFRLGRQYVVDSLGWWSFDGGQVTATTPFFVKVEAYGGFEQRGGMPLSTGRFEGDGVWRGDRTNYDPSLASAFQSAALAPAFGAAIESTGVTWIHGRLTYRRVYDTGASNVTEYASSTYAPAVYDGGRISSERVGYSMDANLATLGGVKAGVVYDFYNAEMTNLYATVDAYAAKKVTVSADYDYYVPTYDADSIWNFFAGEPTNDLGLRANVDVSDRLSLAGGGHVRVFEVQTGPLNPGAGTAYSPYPNYAAGQSLYPTNGHPFDEGGNVSARWRTGETRVVLRGSGNWGGEGDRVGADIAGEHVFETRYVASLRTGVWQWQDKLEPDRSTTSFNYVLGVGYRFAPRSRALIEWEHDVNGLVGQRFRLMLWLTVAVTK
ncbi:MAG TPA: hypothetical protein VGL81_00935 [Polyangiaceae bacterium]|jgi:hypothetical protein